jgi:hypothetical protein
MKRNRIMHNRFDKVTRAEALTITTQSILATAIHSDCPTERKILRDVAKSLIRMRLKINTESCFETLA